MKRYIVIPLLFVVSLVLIIFGGTEVFQNFAKKMNVDEYSCFGSLKTENIEYGNVEATDKLFVVTDDLYYNPISDLRVENPKYNKLKNAFEVKDRKTYAVLDFSCKESDCKDRFDLSVYRTRKAFKLIIDDSTFDALYYCVDDIGQESVYLAGFTDDVCNYILKMIPENEQVKALNEFDIDGTYSLDKSLFDFAFDDTDSNPPERISIKDNKLTIDGKLYPDITLRTDLNAFTDNDDYAITYYVGNEWTNFNSVDVSMYESKSAWTVLSDTEETGYVIFFLDNKIFLAEFVQINNAPPYTEYFSQLIKE